MRHRPQTRPAGDEWRFTPASRDWNAKLRLAAVAERQHGRVRWDQIRRVGVSRTTIGRWVTEGYLHPVLPRIYAVGHVAGGVEADLAAALLYAGPGAMLSHGTAIWWWGLLEHPPATVEIGTPRRCQPLAGVSVHGRRALFRMTHRNLPVTTVAQALLDFAAQGPQQHLRLALANADYRGWLHLPQLDALTGRGSVGASPLARRSRSTVRSSRVPGASWNGGSSASVRPTACRSRR